MVLHPSIPSLPPGWRLLHGVVQADLSVAGYLARGQGVRGVCHTRECRRRMTLDLETLVKNGLGGLPVAAVKRMMACHHPRACFLTFSDEKEGSGIALALAERAQGSAIRFRCTECRRSSQIPVAAVLARLRKSGAGDGDTLHTQVAGKLTKPCKGCGKSAWACELVWPSQAPVWAKTGRLNSDGVRR